jgi:hypothetical protein
MSYSHFEAMFNGQESLSDYDAPFYSPLSRRFKRDKREPPLFYGLEIIWLPVISFMAYFCFGYRH